MEQSNSNGKPKRRLAKKFLAPIVATAASAAASYLAKKAPSYLEQNVLPKLRDAAGGANGAVSKLPERAKAAAGSVGDVAGDLTSRARSVAGGDGSDSDSGSSGAGESGGNFSAEELEQRRAQRAEARNARRTATKR